jgi:hypothetical protein
VDSLNPQPNLQRIDSPRGRKYIVDGEAYPSVTTILSAVGKPFLVPWASRVERELIFKAAGSVYRALLGKSQPSTKEFLALLTERVGKEKAAAKQLREAGEIGTAIHNAVEWHLKSDLDPFYDEPKPSLKHPKVRHAYESWVDWRTKVNLRPVFIERMVYSKQHRYAGTMDLLAYVDDQLTLLDWKSGKAIYREAFYQNAAYRVAVREMGLGDPQRGIIVRVPKMEDDPDFEVGEVPPEKELFDVFLASMVIWNDKEENVSYTKTS